MERMVKNFEELTKGELVKLLVSYDAYIQNANEGDYYTYGWYPVCISEYYDTDFQESVE